VPPLTVRRDQTMVFAGSGWLRLEGGKRRRSAGRRRGINGLVVLPRRGSALFRSLQRWREPMFSRI
jgi:hypothetical protein